ncbi:neuropeptide Y receptor type 2-like [Tropilaelaps mercedesae]|uniref:Neuropeptide Y receptor type 2-like n=1 Tax=Tropilaelaps mercedesae TaxID=418985 RepID=A0A1V9XR79_9ACAR|nr:neuropeptide Y receptor type 2-like [Tropilaelaps mercedesae]
MSAPKYNVSDIPDDRYMMQNMIATFFFVAYLSLNVVAICGSMTIIFLVLRYRNLRSRPINFYYANMAFADLFLASLGAPFRALYYLNMRWTLGAFLCHWFEYAENLGYFVHVYSLTIASFLILQDVSFVRRTNCRSEDTARTTCFRSYAVSSFGVWTFGILACLPYATLRHYVREQCPQSEHHLFLLPEKLYGPFVLVVVPVSMAIASILLIICCACSMPRRCVTTYQERVLLRTQKSTRHVSFFMLLYILCQIPHFALKWLHVKGLAYNDTSQFGASGLRLASVCFTAAYFSYISDEKVLYNVRHVMEQRGKRYGKDGKFGRALDGKHGSFVDKVPLQRVSNTQYGPPGAQSEFQEEVDDCLANTSVNASFLGRTGARVPANGHNNGSLGRNARNSQQVGARRHHADGDDATIPLRRKQPETYV